MAYTKTYSQPYAKTISWTPKGEAEELLWDYCRTKKTSPAGERYTWLDRNPQDVVRDALLFEDIIVKEQPGGGDRSDWEPGNPVKTSLWIENHNALTQRAKEYGTTKQEVIKEVVIDYILWSQV